MKTIAALLALALATTATVRTADACGGYGSFQPVKKETAVGIWPKVSRDAEGKLQLELHYPKFTIGGEYLYMQYFDIVRDARLSRLERVLAGPHGRNVEVTVQEVGAGQWRVVSWAVRPA